MPQRGTLLHRVYRLAMLQYALLYETGKLRKTKLRREIANAEAELLPAPYQEATPMTKLQRMKKKYPTAYKQFVKKMGRKMANEIFRNVAEVPRG